MNDPAAPLHARRILVTRRPEQSSALVAGLRERGATVLEVPLIEIAPPLDPRPLDAALSELDGYAWVAFTSANAVKAVVERRRAAGITSPLPRVASVGPATRVALREHLPEAAVALEPASDFRAEGLLTAFAGLDVSGQRVLLPVSDKARDVLAEGLAARGARVEVVVAYRTVAPAEAGPALARALAEGVDIVTFASPSAVENFVAIAPRAGVGVVAAVIGPVTEARARALGLDVRVVAAPSTAEGLVAALSRAFTDRD